jgi:hypothetical protein
LWTEHRIFDNFKAGVTSKSEAVKDQTHIDLIFNIQFQSGESSQY